MSKNLSKSVRASKKKKSAANSEEPPEAQSKNNERFSINDATDETIQNFIDIIQKYPIVWDKTLPESLNNNKKGDAYVKIEQEMVDAGHRTFILFFK